MKNILVSKHQVYNNMIFKALERYAKKNNKVEISRIQHNMHYALKYLFKELFCKMKAANIFSIRKRVSYKPLLCSSDLCILILQAKEQVRRNQPIYWFLSFPDKSVFQKNTSNCESSHVFLWRKDHLLNAEIDDRFEGRDVLYIIYIQ